MDSDGSEVVPRSSTPTSKRSKKNPPRNNNNGTRTAATSAQKSANTREEDEKLAKKPPKTLEELTAEVKRSKEGGEQGRRGTMTEVVENESGGDGGGKDEAACAEISETVQLNGERSAQQSVLSAVSESSTPRSTDDGADDQNELWESFVVDFQEEMQGYRTMVLAFADGEEDGDFEAAEKRLRSIGLHLVQTANDTQADATIKSRARQLLQYVSGYCQSHGRDELHADFVAYIARCAEG